MALPANEASRLFGTEARHLSNAGTLMHVIKGTMGTGILGLPWALKHAGIVVGPLMLIIIGLINLHCIQLLIDSARHLAKTLHIQPIDYGDVAMHAFRFSSFKWLQSHAAKAKFFVNLCLEMTQLGLCCTYTVFVGQNIRQIVAVYWKHAPDDRVFMAVLCVPFILLGLIKNLSVLAWFSSAANFAAIISICMILRDVLPELPAVSTRPYVVQDSGFAVFVGAAIGAFEGIPVILPVGNAMKAPEDFPMIINISIGLVICIYFTMAFVGYLKFGSAICGSITLNLPLENAFSETTRVLYSFAMFFTFPLQFYVAMEIVEQAIGTQFEFLKRLWCSIVTRISFVVGICLFSIAIPYIGDLNSLIGATSSTMLVVLFPPLFHILAYNVNPSNYASEEESDSAAIMMDGEETSEDKEKENRLNNWIVAKDVIIIVLASLAFTAGLTQTIISIIHDVQNYSSQKMCSGGVGRLKLNHSFASTDKYLIVARTEILNASTVT